MLSRGDVFAARYRVERCIGSGGMGAVFEAEHLETERRVALKVLLPQSLLSESARDRFKQEAKVAARLRHPNVVDVLDAGVDDLTGMPYLVMELLDGEDLGTRVERLGPMPPEEVVAVLRQVGAALDCLHERSIVHRDLKPENIFLTWTPDGSIAVKLLDFGVAKVLTAGKSSAFTQDAQGTPVYMAPEQFAEQIRISAATDIYALGMLTFTLLTGHHYWGPEIGRGMNVFMLARVAEAGPKEPASVRASRAGNPVPPGFDAWFATVTALVPGERFPTASDAVDALGEALGVSEAAGRLDRILSPASSSGAYPVLGPASQRRRSALPEISIERDDDLPPPSSGRVSLSRDEPVPSSRDPRLHAAARTHGSPGLAASGGSSGAPGARAAPDARETPAIPLKKRRSRWQRPSMMTAALVAVGVLVAVANLLVPSAPPGGSSAVGASGGGPSNSAAPLAGAVPSGAASLPAPGASAVEPAPSGDPAPAPAAPSVSASSSASSHPSNSPAASQTPTLGNSHSPVRHAAPTLSAATPSPSATTPRRPKYTRD